MNKFHYKCKKSVLLLEWPTIKLFHHQNYQYNISRMKWIPWNSIAAYFHSSFYHLLNCLLPSSFYSLHNNLFLYWIGIYFSVYKYTHMFGSLYVSYIWQCSKPHSSISWRSSIMLVKLYGRLFLLESKTRFTTTRPWAFLWVTDDGIDKNCVLLVQLIMCFKMRMEKLKTIMIFNKRKY